jgi:hypothetical protein
VDSCAAFGLVNTIAEYRTTWLWKSGFGYGANVGDRDEVTLDYSPDCDPSTSDTFPMGCKLADIAALGKKAPAGGNCAGSGLSVGMEPSNSKPDVYANEVSNIYYLKSSGLGGGITSLFGWVYETPNDGYYLQPNLSVQFSAGIAVAQIGVTPATPWVSIASLKPADIANGMTAAANIMHIAFPTPFAKVLNSGINMTATPCWEIPWDGRYTASKKRRV